MPEARGNPEGAGEEIQKYLDLLSKDPRSRVFAPLAEAYRKAGMLDAAVEVAREGLNHHPAYPSGRVALTRALLERGDHSEARDEITQVVKASPDNLMAQKLLGLIDLRLGDREGAEKAFSMVLMLDPRDVEAQRFLEELTAPPPPSPQQVPPIEETPAAALEIESPAEEVPEAAPPIPAAVEETAETAPEPAGWDGVPETSAATGKQPAAAGEVPGEESSHDEGAGEEGDEKISTEPVFDLSQMEEMARAAEEDLPAEEPSGDSPFEVFTKDSKDAVPPPGDRSRKERPDEPFEQLFEGEELAEEAPQPPPAEAEPDVGDESPVFDLTGENGIDEPEAGIFDEPEHESPAWTPEEPVTAGEPPSAPGAIDDGEAVSPPQAPAGDDEPLFAGTAVEIPAPETSPDVAVSPPAGEYTVPLDDFDDEAETAGMAPPSPPPAQEGDQGIFDTETLADLYIKQGFYEKAAEVYRRLVSQSPGDGQLRQKLEEVLLLQRTIAAVGAPEPPAPAPEPPAPAEEAPAEEAPAEEAPAEEAPAEEALAEPAMEFQDEAPASPPPAAAEDTPATPSPAGGGSDAIAELEHFLKKLKEMRR